MRVRRINADGRLLIKGFEGLSLVSYQDIAGVWTIGYGHTGGVKAGTRITELQAEVLLTVDLELTESGVDMLTSKAATPLSDNQFSALVCFAYNLGLERLRTSRLLMHVKRGDFTLAANDFLLWDHSKGVRVAGLTRRRQAERTLFLKPTSAEVT